VYRLLLFLRKIYVLVIFLILEGLALHYYANSTVHSRARLLGVSDDIVGGVYGAIAGAENYMNLRRTNTLLESRVEALENERAVWKARHEALRFDSIKASPSFPHEYLVARVVRNSINKRENYIMVDRGWRDGVERGMAVASLDGYMVG
jgi:rod shape-determining protein MreC